MWSTPRGRRVRPFLVHFAPLSIVPPTSESLTSVVRSAWPVAGWLVASRRHHPRRTIQPSGRTTSSSGRTASDVRGSMMGSLGTGETHPSGMRDPSLRRQRQRRMRRTCRLPWSVLGQVEEPGFVVFRPAAGAANSDAFVLPEFVGVSELRHRAGPLEAPQTHLTPAIILADKSADFSTLSRPLENRNGVRQWTYARRWRWRPANRSR